MYKQIEDISAAHLLLEVPATLAACHRADDEERLPAKGDALR